jgi:TonB family protein
MKKSAFTAIFTITAMVLSSLITPCRAQVPESLVEGMTVDKDPVYICEEVDEDMVFTTYETQPEFPGGSPALLAYIKNELRYPKKCREAGVEGRTIITFVVKKNGKVKNFEVARSSGDKLLDKEAVRVIKKMPRWIPGTQCGTPVPVKFLLPVKRKGSF